jgi:hypothetical protein
MSADYTAISVTPPAQGVVRATVTTSEEITIFDVWRTRWVTVQADGADVWVRLGAVLKAAASPAVTAARVTTSTGTPPTIALAVNASMHIPSGLSRDFDLSQFKLEASDAEKWEVRLAHISLATTGYIRIIPTSGKAVLA